MSDWRHGTDVPDERYFRFMDSLIPGRDILSRRYDPFAIFPLDPARHGDYNVEHMPQWGLAIAPGNHIIAGQRGTGKTSFCSNLSYSPPDGILVAYLLPAVVDLNHGRFLSNNRRLLLQSIAGAFWRQIARVSDLYSGRNPDPAWVRLLCWWFRRFPPQENSSHRALEALGQDCRDEDSYRSDDCLRDAVRLVTEWRTSLSSDKNLRRLMIALFSVEELGTHCADLGVNPENIPNYGRDLESFAREIIGFFTRRGRKAELITVLRKERPNANWAYIEQPQGSWKRVFDHIRLFVEIPQGVSLEQQCQLIEDATKLTLSYQRLYVTVFIDRRILPAVHKLRANWPYCPEIAPLPIWTAEDLKMLLWRRLRASDFPPDSPPPDDPLPKLGRCLSKAAREKFTDIVVESALRAEQDTEAAPVHALRLARLLLIECAQRQTGLTALNPGDLRSLCNRYWVEREQTEKEARYA